MLLVAKLINTIPQNTYPKSSTRKALRALLIHVRYMLQEATETYNDVHLCRKAQTRQSPKAEWFIDI